MARPLACRSPYQNSLLTGKDKFAGPAPIESSDTYTPLCAVSHAHTLASPAVLAFALAAVDLTVRYLEADLQRIFRTVLETCPCASAPQPLVFLDGPCERPLKVRFPELYCDKTHIECYNFIQQYKDHFVTAGAKRPNRMPFAAMFFQEQTLIHWQQHKAKNAGETNVPLT